MDVTATVTGGRRAFFRAEQRGDENVMKLLLQLGDAKADGEDMKYGGIPLWWGAKGGHEGVAKWLLEREDINPNAADKRFRQTPLSSAARSGNTRVLVFAIGKGRYKYQHCRHTIRANATLMAGKMGYDQGSE